MNLNLLTHAYYLFDPSPSIISVFFWIFVGFFVLTIIGSVVLNKIQTRGLAKKLMKGYPKIFLWLGVTGLLVEFFRYENVPYLSMRAITYLLTVLIIGFVGRVLYVRFNVYPKEYKMMLDDAEKKKYLPKKKI